MEDDFSGQLQFLGEAGRQSSTERKAAEREGLGSEPRKVKSCIVLRREIKTLCGLHLHNCVFSLHSLGAENFLRWVGEESGFKEKEGPLVFCEVYCED